MSIFGLYIELPTIVKFDNRSINYWHRALKVKRKPIRKGRKLRVAA